MDIPFSFPCGVVDRTCLSVLLRIIELLTWFRLFFLITNGKNCLDFILTKREQFDSQRHDLRFWIQYQRYISPSQQSVDLKTRHGICWTKNELFFYLRRNVDSRYLKEAKQRVSAKQNHLHLFRMRYYLFEYGVSTSKLYYKVGIHSFYTLSSHSQLVLPGPFLTEGPHFINPFFLIYQ